MPQHLVEVVARREEMVGMVVGCTYTLATTTRSPRHACPMVVVVVVVVATSPAASSGDCGG